MNSFWSSRLRRAVAVAGLSAFAAAALVSVVQAARTMGSSSASPAALQQYGHKVTICHRTHSRKHPFVTIRVSERAVPAHLRHGDRLGPCDGQSFTVCHKSKAGKQSMKVKFKALSKHMRQGDTLGRCKSKKNSPGGQGRGKGPKPKQPKPKPPKR